MRRSRGRGTLLQKDKKDKTIGFEKPYLQKTLGVVKEYLRVSSRLEKNSLRESFPNKTKAMFEIF